MKHRKVRLGRICLRAIRVFLLGKDRKMKTKWTVGLVVLAAMTMVFGVEGKGGEALYTVVDVGVLSDRADRSEWPSINNSGQVVGRSYGYAPNDSGWRAFIWDSINGIQPLGSMPGGQASEASDINNVGQVVGGDNSAVGNRAFVWDSTNGIQPLNALPSWDGSFAYGINDAGQIVGEGSYPNGGPWQSCIWEPDGSVAEIDAPRARDINAHGQIIGRYNNNHKAYVWDSVSGMREFPGGDSSEAYSINDSGQVVGWIWGAWGGGRRAFIWDDTNGMRDLGGLRWPVDSSTAYGINNAGQVVGAWGSEHACIWNSIGELEDLNDLIDATSGWTLVSATGINDNGWIVGNGINPDGDHHVFLLIPEPATLSLLALGSLVALRRRRR